MFDRMAQFLGIKKDQKERTVSRRILVVDDDDLDLVLVRKTVEKMGHTVLTAKNGREGFDIAKSSKPDLILSDCRMPDVDGIAMCRLLKDDPETKDIPLVFLTGVDTPATVVECFDMGVDNYMCKPINPQLLKNQIKSIFDEHLAP